RRGLADSRPQASGGARRCRRAPSGGGRPHGLRRGGAGGEFSWSRGAGDRRGVGADARPIRPQSGLGRRRGGRAPLPPSPGGHMKRRILLVEDDSGLREALCEVLIEMGYEVMSTPDGLRGLSLAVEQEEPCPIVLDWRMPVVDGPEFLARLRRLPRG